MAVAVWLVKDRHGGERRLWREHRSIEIGECNLWRNEMETVAAQFCDAFERELKSWKWQAEVFRAREVADRAENAGKPKEYVDRLRDIAKLYEKRAEGHPGGQH